MKTNTSLCQTQGSLLSQGNNAALTNNPCKLNKLVKPMLSTLFLATAVAVGIPTALAARPTGLPVIDKAYNAKVNQVGSRLTITSDKNKNNALLLWNSFNVNSNKTVEFAIDGVQANSKPVSFLNVVTGPGRSNIDGSILDVNNHNGKVNFYLINPNGINVSKSAVFINMNQVYLGTQKVSQKLLDQFKNGAAPAIEMAALPNNKGMGKVSLIGTVKADNLKINGSQIVIADASNIVTADRQGSVELHSSTNRIDVGGAKQDKASFEKRINGSQIVIADASNIVTADRQGSVELHSSTNRIDVGGAKQDKASFEKRSGLNGVSGKQVKASGAHDNGQYVEHFDQKAIYSIPLLDNPYDSNTFDEIANDLNGNYWLADDLVVGANDRLIGDQAFTGKIDGAFHTIKFTGELSKNGQSADYGVFGKLDGAHIANLKVMSEKLVVKDDLKGSKINLGVVAGTIKDSTLHNVEVVDFNYSFAQGLVSADSALGALAGKSEGKNTFSNVLSYYDVATQDMLGQKAALGQLKYIGSLVGNNEGTINTNLLVSGISQAKSQYKLNAIAMGNKQDVSSDINSAYDKALHALMAQGKSKQQAEAELNSTYAFSLLEQGGKSTVVFGANKGFLKPFFIEDFNFTYDGKIHNYEDLVNNEGFKLENLLSKNNTLNYAQKDAGNYGFNFVTRAENQDLGHEYFFSYQYAGDTWDQSQGGSLALQNRSNRADALMGVGTLNINKKTISLELKDQTIEHDGKPNLEINRDTINNYDQVIGSLVHGDKIDDLHLSLQLNGSTISASANSNNYEVVIKDGVLTKKPAPVPTVHGDKIDDLHLSLQLNGSTISASANSNNYEVVIKDGVLTKKPAPVPTPDPLPQPQPEEKPEVNPNPLPQEPEFNPQDKPNDDSNKSFADLVGAQSKCQNCSHYEQDKFLPFAWLMDNSYVSLAGLDFSEMVFSYLDPDYDESSIFMPNNNKLVAYNDVDLTMSTTKENFKLMNSTVEEHSLANKLSQLAMEIKHKAEYVLSMIANKGEHKDTLDSSSQDLAKAANEAPSKQNADDLIG